MFRTLIVTLIALTGCGTDINSTETSEFAGANHPTNYSEDEEEKFQLHAAGSTFHWKYFASKDFGLRSDTSGDGAFGAYRRGTPSHTGIDFLMPEGTPLSAPCSGIYLSGYESGFGNWVQLICAMPSPTGNGPSLYASMIFAHLSTRAPSDSYTWRSISSGGALGKSGRTGNAKGTNPHVHFDMNLHKTLSAAKNELHGGLKSTPAHTSAFQREFQRACVQQYGFGFKENERLIRGDRIDPFAFFSCFSTGKPALSTPVSQRLVRWSELYKATEYNVDTGR